MDLSSYEKSQVTDTLEAVNMEAPVTAEEVVQAGGIGATDDIGCILPGASDSTDFENHLQDVRAYEDSVDSKAQGQPIDIPKVGEADCESKVVFEGVYMEAYVDSDDVIRAGGYGATDNISSFLPVASDFTDFEASLRDARDYEDLKEEVTRPGLGWTNDIN